MKQRKQQLRDKFHMLMEYEALQNDKRILFAEIERDVAVSLENPQQKCMCLNVLEVQWFSSHWPGVDGGTHSMKDTAYAPPFRPPLFRFLENLYSFNLYILAKMRKMSYFDP